MKGMLQASFLTDHFCLCSHDLDSGIVCQYQDAKAHSQAALDKRHRLAEQLNPCPADRKMNTTKKIITNMYSNQG